MASPADQLTQPERRAHLRHKVHSPAYATTEESSSFILPHLNEIVDIGEEGICFQNSSPRELKEILPMCLDLSETGTRIEAEGEVVWSSESGRTGIRFRKISPESLQQLRQWLFINNMIACVNHSSSAKPTEVDQGLSKESLEFISPLLADHTSALTAVGAIGREVAALGADVDAALQLISDRAQVLTRATGAAIALSGSQNMICRASSGADAPPAGVTLEIGSGFSGECVRTGQLLHCEDSEADSRVDRQSCRALGVRSMIAAPVQLDGLVVGLLEVFSPEVKVFTNSDKDILQRLADMVAHVIRRSTPLTDTSPETVNNFVHAPEQEDTDGSSRRTRLLLALAAAAVATLLALVVIPRVRSKVTDVRPVVQSSVPAVQKISRSSETLSESLDGLRQLAEKGDATAQFALGIRYATGEQVKQDYTEAARWFSLAADRGQVKAQSVLAAYYWAGTGVPKDLSKAYFWAILARANGDEASAARAAELATRISYNDRNAIQQQADEWLREHTSSTASTQ